MKFRAWCTIDECFYFSDDMLHFSNGTKTVDIKNSSFSIHDLKDF